MTAVRFVSGEKMVFIAAEKSFSDRQLNHRILLSRLRVNKWQVNQILINELKLKVERNRYLIFISHRYYWEKLLCEQ